MIRLQNILFKCAILESLLSIHHALQQEKFKASVKRTAATNLFSEEKIYLKNNIIFLQYMKNRLKDAWTKFDCLHQPTILKNK